MIVPLVRPNFPDPEKFTKRWQRATRASGQFSNFGPLWHELADRLEQLTGRAAYPCSSGTEAVALAINASQSSFGEPTVSYEAFTFEATRLAAERLDPHATPIRTGSWAPRGGHDDSIVVRTVPFGSHRDFTHDGRGLVIDAAGAFGGDMFKSYPGDALIACSFHATKNFPIGEGGCVFAPAGAGWAKRSIMAAMNFGYSDTREIVPGYKTNAKLDELRCAMLLEQLERPDYFSLRSARIATTSRIVATAGVGATLPYDVGAAQSLVVVCHKDPDRLVGELGANGFIARRVYHPFVKPDLLVYDEAHLVALPSDMSPDELDLLINVMGGMS